MGENDRDLTEVFQAARSAERGNTPPFRRVLQGRPGRRRTGGPVRAVLVLGGAAGLGLLFVLLGRSGALVPDHELARRVMAWRSSTDFLLPVHSRGLTSFIPRIGEAPAGSPLQALDPGHVLGPPILKGSPRT